MQAATGNTVTMAQAAINSLTDTINQGYDNWLSRTKFLEKEFQKHFEFDFISLRLD